MCGCTSGESVVSAPSERAQADPVTDWSKPCPCQDRGVRSTRAADTLKSGRPRLTAHAGRQAHPICLLSSSSPPSFKPPRNPPRAPIPDPGIIATGQRITPAGVQTVFTGKVGGVRFGASSQDIIVAVPGSIQHVAWRDNRVISRARVDGRPGIYALAIDPVTHRVFSSSVGRLVTTGPQRATQSGGRAAPDLRRQRSRRLGRRRGSTPARSATSWPALPRLRSAPARTANGSPCCRFRPTTRSPSSTPRRARSFARFRSVSNRSPPSSPPTRASRTSRCSADRSRRPRSAPRCSAATPRVGGGARRRARHRRAGERGARRSRDRRRHATSPSDDIRRRSRGTSRARKLYVAAGNSDSVTIVDTRSNAVVDNIAIAPFRERKTGLAPTALALSPDHAHALRRARRRERGRGLRRARRRRGSRDSFRRRGIRRAST